MRNPDDKKKLEEYEQNIFKKKATKIEEVFKVNTICWLQRSIKVKKDIIVPHYKRKINGKISAWEIPVQVISNNLNKIKIVALVEDISKII